EEVAGLEPGLVGGSVLVDLDDLEHVGAALEADAEIGAVAPAEQAEPAAAPAFALGQTSPRFPVGVDRDVDVLGDGEADPAVNADDLAAHVEQRAARVAAHR